MNTIATPSWTGRKVLVVASNECRFVGAITKKLSDDFMVEGTKVGATVERPPARPLRHHQGPGAAAAGPGRCDRAITITDQANIGSAGRPSRVRSKFRTWRTATSSRRRSSSPTPGTRTALACLSGRVLGGRHAGHGAERQQHVSQRRGASDQLRVSVGTAQGADQFADARLDREREPLAVQPAAAISELWKEAMFSGPALSWDQWYEDVNVFPHVTGARRHADGQRVRVRPARPRHAGVDELDHRRIV
jgi:hypothetical protein